jgi:hypothetical protein
MSETRLSRNSLRARLFGQGASASFDNFTTLTIPGSAGPLSPAEIASALAAAQA